jgi:hypothetical protein
MILDDVGDGSFSLEQELRQKIFSSYDYWQKSLPLDSDLIDLILTSILLNKHLLVRYRRSFLDKYYLLNFLQYVTNWQYKKIILTFEYQKQLLLDMPFDSKETHDFLYPKHGSLFTQILVFDHFQRLNEESYCWVFQALKERSLGHVVLEDPFQITALLDVEEEPKHSAFQQRLQSSFSLSYAIYGRSEKKNDGNGNHLLEEHLLDSLEISDFFLLKELLSRLHISQDLEKKILVFFQELFMAYEKKGLMKETTWDNLQSYIQKSYDLHDFIKWKMFIKGKNESSLGDILYYIPYMTFKQSLLGPIELQAYYEILVDLGNKHFLG